MKYLITYDLLTPGQDYNNLYVAIENLSSDYQRMQNVWFVKSTYSASQIIDTLATKVDKNDKIFVCEPRGWALYNIENVARFLKD